MHKHEFISVFTFQIHQLILKKYIWTIKTLLHEDTCLESKLGENRVCRPFMKSFKNDSLNRREFKDDYHTSMRRKSTNFDEETRTTSPPSSSLNVSSNDDLREFIFRESLNIWSEGSWLVIGL